MPTDGDSLKCAACGCHRSFHRKDDARRHHHQLMLPATATTSRTPLLLPLPHPNYVPLPSFPYHARPAAVVAPPPIRASTLSSSSSAPRHQRRPPYATLNSPSRFCRCCDPLPQKPSTPVWTLP
uniref:ZF-HD dimerization-type domain-containing protein n=1 Tax=Zea mays TaxID=4577 RepID=A0A804LW09_MAIZE